MPPAGKRHRELSIRDYSDDTLKKAFAEAYIAVGVKAIAVEYGITESEAKNMLVKCVSVLDY